MTGFKERKKPLLETLQQMIDEVRSTKNEKTLCKTMQRELRKVMEKSVTLYDSIPDEKKDIYDNREASIQVDPPRKDLVNIHIGMNIRLNWKFRGTPKYLMKLMAAFGTIIGAKTSSDVLDLITKNYEVIAYYRDDEGIPRG
jgi:hypothetical protein